MALFSKLVASDLDGASLLDSGMRATEWGGFRFVPVALWTPDGWSDGAPGERLDAYTTAYRSIGVQPDGTDWLEFDNALWVRARIPVALGFAPPTGRDAHRYQFLDAALLAASSGAGEPWITPFVCTDDGLRAELRFAGRCPPERRREVAAAFWGLLASAPTALANYRDRFMFSDGHDLSPAVVGYWRGEFHVSCCRR